MIFLHQIEKVVNSFNTIKMHFEIKLNEITERGNFTKLFASIRSKETINFKNSNKQNFVLKLRWFILRFLWHSIFHVRKNLVQMFLSRTGLSGPKNMDKYDKNRFQKKVKLQVSNIENVKYPSALRLEQKACNVCRLRHLGIAFLNVPCILP